MSAAAVLLPATATPAVSASAETAAVTAIARYGPTLALLCDFLASRDTARFNALSRTSLTPAPRCFSNCKVLDVLCFLTLLDRTLTFTTFSARHTHQHRRGDDPRGPCRAPVCRRGRQSPCNCGRSSSRCRIPCLDYRRNGHNIARGRSCGPRCDCKR